MTFWRNYYHLVWATKNREHLITAELEKALYAYIVSKADEIGIIVYAINGWYDHTHLVGAIPPKLAVAEVVKKLIRSKQFFCQSCYQTRRGAFCLATRLRLLECWGETTLHSHRLCGKSEKTSRRRKYKCLAGKV